ncbi:MAG: transglutaminaseTgpA domain-containing protein, partial [Acidimicrobiales bacterium]
MGISACGAQGELSLRLAAATGGLVVAGNVVSYFLRHRSLGYLKVALGAAMLAAFVWFFVTVSREAGAGTLSSVEDPLAALFAVMQAAHSFDVPSRRDLGFSLAGSATLVAVAAAGAVDLAFGVFVLAWAVFAVTGLAAAWSSMAGGARVRLRWVLVPTVAAVAIAALLIALLPAPRSPELAASGLFGGHDGASEPAHLVPATSSGPRAPAPSGAAGVRGYLGFAGSLDTADRPSLGDQVVLRVRADRPTYWLAETFDTWSGRSWSQPGPQPLSATRRRHVPSGATGSDASSGVAGSSNWQTLSGGSPFLIGPVRSGPLVPPGTGDGGRPLLGNRVPGGRGTPDFQTFYLAARGSDLVLHASAPTVVWLPARHLYASSSGTIESPEALGAGSVYSVLSTVTTPSPAQLGASNGTAGLTATMLKSTLELPRAYPRVAALAHRVTAGQSTDEGRITALERWIGNHTKYTTQIPPLSRGQDTVDQFLFGSRRGYCEQISTALTVMLRTIGIPAREAVGYVPGPFDPITGLYDEEAKDAHAWVQVWFPGYGWQSFDPTAYVPLANPSPGAALGHDFMAALRRIPVVATASIAGVLLLALLALWWRRRRPATWRAAVTRELERAARRAG